MNVSSEAGKSAGKSRLDAPPEGGQGAGRIAGTFYQNENGGAAAPAHKAKLAAAAEAAAEAAKGNVLGTFKTDPKAPIDIEADTLDVYDTAKQAVFRGNVKSQQGDFIVRTVEMISFYSGPHRVRLGHPRVRLAAHPHGGG